MVALKSMRLTGLDRSCVFMDVFEGFVSAEALKSDAAFWMATHVNGNPPAVLVNVGGAGGAGRAPEAPAAQPAPVAHPMQVGTVGSAASRFGAIASPQATHQP